MRVAISRALKGLFFSQAQLPSRCTLSDESSSVVLMVSNTAPAMCGQHNQSLSFELLHAHLGLYWGIELVPDGLRERSLRFIEIARLHADQATVT
jgi:hypothetical protein